MIGRPPAVSSDCLCAQARRTARSPNKVCNATMSKGKDVLAIVSTGWAKGGQYEPRFVHTTLLSLSFLPLLASSPHLPHTDTRAGTLQRAAQQCDRPMHARSLARGQCWRCKKASFSISFPAKLSDFRLQLGTQSSKRLKRLNFHRSKMAFFQRSSLGATLEAKLGHQIETRR